MKKKTLYLRNEEEGPYGEAYLLKQKERLQCKTESQAIAKIFEEHDQLLTKLSSQDDLVEAIFDRFKTSLDVLRIRTGYVDKNVRVALELWNGFLMANKQENYLSTKEFKASALKEAEQTVSNIITEQQIKMKERAEKKKQREMKQNE